jgi:hypothetical protein
MHFPRFWQAAETGQVKTWGWSDTCPDEALAKARERQKRVFAWLDGGCETEWLNRYGYPDRPMREEVLREFRGPDGELAAAQTRNSVGCFVLNTTRLVFVDVDAREGGIGSFVRGLFGGKKADPQAALEDKLRQKAEQWTQTHRDWRWRMYRTRAGVRLMAVHRAMPPDDPLVEKAFDHFGADRCYRTLCRNQRCFRARLTPKPWRIDVDKPPYAWPWLDAEAEAMFREWDAEYLGKAAAFATCRLIGEFGPAPAAPEFAALIALHDKATRIGEELPLA